MNLDNNSNGNKGDLDKAEGLQHATPTGRHRRPRSPRLYLVASIFSAFVAGLYSTKSNRARAERATTSWLSNVAGMGQMVIQPIEPRQILRGNARKALKEAASVGAPQHSQRNAEMNANAILIYHVLPIYSVMTKR